MTGPARPPPAQPPPSQPRRLIVADLLGGQHEAVLVHNGQDYHLRITKTGKLILTK